MTPQLPEGELLYAVGDIHGRADLLSDLLLKIEADAAGRGAVKKTLVFLGDYVDRGPDSHGVVELLLKSLPKDFDGHFLKGNHEALLLDVLADPQALDRWFRNGGEATLKSYGVDIDGLRFAKAPAEAWHEAFTAVLLEAHRSFFETLRLQISAGDYLFVHAGIRPGVPIDAQVESDLIWIRDDFLDWAEPLGKVVVHGHTAVPEPTVRANRIGIDTGAVFSDRLTALRLQNGERGFLRT